MTTALCEVQLLVFLGHEKGLVMDSGTKWSCCNQAVLVKDFKAIIIYGIMES